MLAARSSFTEAVLKLACAGVVCGLLGCSAGRPPASAGESAASEAEPSADSLVKVKSPSDLDGATQVTSVDEAATAFERAELELASLFGVDEHKERGDNTESAAPQPARPRRAGMPAPSPQAQPLSAGGVCENACSALASMRRAAERLCSLTGQEDPRCDSVTSRVTDAERRVVSMCPDCG